ncbi:MAG: glycosyltransferase [Alphaproteobacteria bacterium]|nr:glycosyltransferase [Alphaproteobacteria bacterium]MBU1513367.1 glycosyltransferase [Alphaproteobacteria bacterium]MBU2096359.1 glycosyltransferase [Alphaproteobacteria bacterium]MBU2149949.1 glycosyltransferase [Alphaproteobacteria bacterium]MBU2309853.1 glycosyltransferase [Alphaproteobacteria bacterium]
MPTSFRATAASALRVVRRWPPVHAVVHAIALQLIKTRWGERFVRGVVGPEAQTDAEYRAWTQAYDTLTDDDRDAIRAHIDRFAERPLISVAMTAYRSDPGLLREAVASVQGQLYPHWELCIADDGSPGETTWRTLTDLAAGDPRIRIVRRDANGGIAAATNSALALTTGEFVAFLDHDDLLAEHALYEVAAELDLHPDADLIFSDEDKIDETGVRSQPHHKTDWNAELMLGVNAVNHLTVIRRALLSDLGGVREGFDGAQDHDLVLRAAERARLIRHIPWVLYHWRWQGKQGSFSRARADECASAAARAVQDHMDRTGQPATVEVTPGPQRWLRVRRAIPAPRPLVSLIVPTRDRADLVAQCAEGVLAKTDYAPLELLIVDNGSQEPATHALFERLKTDPRVRILPAPGPFNFSALNNLAAAQARGEVLILLNNDISMIGPDWLKEMVSQAERPNVGAVGAKLYYPDKTLQHAGVVLGVGDVARKVAGHLYAGAGSNHPGYQGHLALARNVSAVTAACLAIRKAVYDEVGGMDADQLAVAFNDVDLCLKVRAAGYDIVWTPHAALFHHESASRGSDLAPEKVARFEREIGVMRDRWGAVLDADPFYGPVFDKRFTNYRLGTPPDRVAPWMRTP